MGEFGCKRVILGTMLEASKVCNAGSKHYYALQWSGSDMDYALCMEKSEGEFSHKISRCTAGVECHVCCVTTHCLQTCFPPDEAINSIVR